MVHFIDSRNRVQEFKASVVINFRPRHQQQYTVVGSNDWYVKNPKVLKNYQQD
jgi:hypothetical protein